MKRGGEKIKSTTSSIIKEILKSLKTGDKSITDVAKDAQINWETAYNYLNTLEQVDLVNKKEEGKKIIYTLLQKRRDTLFGLPLSKEQENKINFIYSKIIEKYKSKHKGSLPNKSFLHKTATYIIQEQKLVNLPVIWYLYGQMCVKIYSEEQDYTFETFEGMKGIEKAIDLNISTYDDKKTWRMREEQYNDNPFYSAKEKVYWQLRDLKNKEQFQKDFMIFFGQAMINNIDYNNDVSGILTDYLSLINRIDIKDKLLTNRICNLFDEIWRFIALKVVFNNLKVYYKEELLHYLIDDRINEQKTIVQKLLSNIFEDLKPLIVDSRLKKLQNSFKKKTGKAK